MKKKGVECSKCSHWNELSGNLGECRVNPPMSVPKNIPGTDPERGTWLKTTAEDWCSFFKPGKVEIGV